MENMKNDTTFVRMRSGDHLRDAKMSKKKGTSLCRIKLFFLVAIDRNGFRRTKEEWQIYKTSSIFLIFAWGLSYDLSKFSVILPLFSTLKDHK